MSDKPFCLDIGESYLKLADVELKKKSLVARAAGYTEMPFNIFSVTSQEYIAKAAELIQKLVKDSQVKKTDVRVVIPDSQSYTRIFDMPLLTDKELVSAIRYQADQFIPVPIDQVSLDIHVITKDKNANRTNILLVAATHTVVNQIVKMVEDAALIPVNIENETSAVLRLISEINTLTKQKDGGASVFINLGSTSSSIYLFDMSKNVPLQVHNFAIGYQIFFKDIKANYMLNDDQIRDLIERVGFTKQQSQYNLHELLASPLNEFVSEVQRFILSSKEQSTADVKSVYIFGEGAKFAGISEKVSEMIGLPVSLFNLSQQFEKSNISDFFAQDWPLLIPAVGGSL
jgi:type IV pilus assembly protein PilM